MHVDLKLTDDAEARIIKNLWPLYVHDISEFDGSTPNPHGLNLEDDRVATLAEQGETLGAWWKDPGSLFPYLILADSRPAGFNLIAAPPHIPEGIRADFVVHEFFVMHAFRGDSVSERAAIDGFERHRGRWEIVTYPNHPRAIAFWRRVIRRYAGDSLSEKEADHPWGRKVIFAFDNERAAGS